MATTLPPLMQQAIDRAKRQGLLPKNFTPPRIANNEQDKLRLSRMLDSETLFRFAYVPFVICELVWDYADTIVSITKYLKLHETKPLNRAIKELRTSYDRRRAKFVDSEHHASEQENMLVFEDGVHSIFKLYVTNLRCDLKSEYPELQRSHLDLMEAVYQCWILLKSLYRYVDGQERKIARLLKRNVGHVLPEEIYRLGHIIQAYIGDKPISEQFRKQQDTYAAILANKIALVGLNKLKDEALTPA